jgi:DNA-binding MarR family transcriptional regulator
LSAALRRLEGLGYVTRMPQPDDRRAIELRLTAKGAKALGQTSVLEAARVRTLLETLTVEERTSALDGLGILGRAARSMGRR